MDFTKMNLLIKLMRLALLLAIIQPGIAVRFAYPAYEESQPSIETNWDQRVEKILKPAKGEIILTAVGDMIFNQEISDFPEPDNQNLYRIMRDAHIAYGNLEMSLNERPGTHRVAYDFRQGRDFAWEIAKIGINLVSLANNHSLDYGTDGLRDCLRILRQSGISYAGAGLNLVQARAPRIEEIYRTKFALLSYFVYRGASGQANPGEPTISGIGAPVVLIEKQDGKVDEVCAPLEADVRAMEDAIILAKRSADIVMVQFHIHEVSHSRAYGIPNAVTPIQSLLVHKALDAGADIFLGNGPHVLRGIEVYKGKPIFYSFGNFIYQWKTPNKIPEIVWSRDQETMSGYEGIDPSLKGIDPREEAETVVSRLTIRDKKVQKIELFPVTLDVEGPRMGSPKLANDKRAKEIIEYLQRLSQPFKTKIAFKDWYGVIEF